MADIAVTATAVTPGPGAVLTTYTAGVTITAGQPVYLDPADSLVKLADCDAATAPPRSPIGIAVNGASAGQPVEVQSQGDITMNAVLTKGGAFYLSATAGRIAPAADLVNGWFPVLLILGKTTTTGTVVIREAGSALP